VLTHRGREDARRSVFERLDPAEHLDLAAVDCGSEADLQLTLT
jgi:hypothetical protein